MDERRAEVKPPDAQNWKERIMRKSSGALHTPSGMTVARSARHGKAPCGLVAGTKGDSGLGCGDVAATRRHLRHVIGRKHRTPS